MTRPIIVVGGGGHAKVLIDALRLASAFILGLVEKHPGHPQTILGVPLLGTDEELEKYPPEKVQLVNGVGGARDTRRRREIFERFKGRGYTFRQVLHPAAVISGEAFLGEGVQVMAGAIVLAGANIGANTLINTKSSVDHDCQLGAHVHLAPGVTLCGEVHIKDSVLVGSGATILPGVTIGPNSLIAAGALVHRDIPPGATVIGVPGRIKGS